MNGIVAKTQQSAPGTIANIAAGEKRGIANRKGGHLTLQKCAPPSWSGHSTLFDNFSARITHLFDRFWAIGGIQINRAHRVAEGPDFEASLQSIEYRMLDAIVSCQSAYPDLLDALFAQELRQLRAVESGIAVRTFIYSF